MKNWIASLGIIAVLAVLIFTRSHATTFPVANAFDTSGLTIMFQASTNASSGAFYAERYAYHTFQVINGAPAASNTTVLWWSLDSTNWIPFSTNVFTATLATNSVTLRGKYSYFEAVTTLANATNGNVQVLYLGGN